MMTKRRKETAGCELGDDRSVIEKNWWRVLAGARMPPADYVE